MHFSYYQHANHTVYYIVDIPVYIYIYITCICEYNIALIVLVYNNFHFLRQCIYYMEWMLRPHLCWTYQRIAHSLYIYSNSFHMNMKLKRSTLYNFYFIDSVQLANDIMPSFFAMCRENTLVLYRSDTKVAEAIEPLKVGTVQLILHYSIFSPWNQE